jgi:chaperonin GroES
MTMTDEPEVTPLGSRVLLKLVEEESVTASGLVLPDTAREKPQRGEVVAVGDDEEAIKVSPGDLVLFPKYSGTELKLEGLDHLILEAGDLLAVLRPRSGRAA